MRLQKLATNKVAGFCKRILKFISRLLTKGGNYSKNTFIRKTFVLNINNTLIRYYKNST